MKKLEDYEKTLKTCSKCGLCQSVCPIYKETGRETVVSRGKFNLLLGLIKGQLKYTKNIDKMLSMCLHCKACDDFCPSSIKATEIIVAFKNKYKKYCFPFKYDSFFKFKMFFLSFIFKAYRFSLFPFIAFKIKKIIRKFGLLGKLFLLFDKISKINVKRKKTTNKICNPTMTVIYFEGCFTKYLNPSVRNALLNLLEKNNVKVIRKNFNCCGISALYSGKKELFEKIKEKNLQLMNEPCDYIVCDCASCLSTLKEYDKTINSKIVDIFELLSKFQQKCIQDKITYHLPCHLREEKNKITHLLEKTFSNYKEMTEFDSCCGFSGDFALNFPQISQQISKRKAEYIVQNKSDYVLTSCPGCIIGLNKGLIDNNIEKKVLNLVEFLEINS